ncbi:MAG: aminopeptidase N [Hyphomicrobiales bacterium]|nr:aminopeptidase N [Hyphomicrobiales bacterium]
MRTESPPRILLADYRPPDFLVDRVRLDVSLDRAATRVVAKLSIRPNPAVAPGAPLKLDGDGLVPVRVALDGRGLAPDASWIGPDGLVLRDPPSSPFELEVETRLDPSANTKLMGLYRSGPIYCTQCEAEGFRRITYFPDRPDVLSTYVTRIEADRREAPTLLGNGNPVEAGELPGGRHFAIWDDPHPKPCYLFALVAGDLEEVADGFVTRSGRSVRVAVLVERGKGARARYALDAIKRSMEFDERVFGREYDLDVFNLVAVSDFNMGAMENKGLNVFNDKYVLVSPETATDGDYANVEAIVGHEYFHNWTGNRITCRDWFQLCLKEGLTVFRDQEFTSDQRSRAVKRIADVRALRATQFPEDAGPLAHPVRPDAYAEINNFYTATVYEKGAEVVRMLRALIGERAFAAGLDLYFRRCDGTAATVEDFIGCFADASGRDLSGFMRWYSQAGTPKVTSRATYDPASRRLTLRLGQETAPTPGQPDKAPLVMPVALGLVGADGRDLPLKVAGGDDALARQAARGTFEFAGAALDLTFEDVAERPAISLMRGFSAPVRIVDDATRADRLRLMAKDRDPVSRWNAAQTVATEILVSRVTGSGDASAEGVAAAFGEVFAQAKAGAIDPAFAALMLALPGESDLARELPGDIDPDAVRAARLALRAEVARPNLGASREAFAAGASAGPYSPDAASAGRRALRLAALDWIAAADPEDGGARALAAFEAADNMTERFGALAALCALPGARREAALDAFATRYEGDALTLDKWLSVQAGIGEPDTLARVERLERHPAYAPGNPNRVRALVGAFAGNPTQFNRADGAGYRFLAERAVAIDGRNPQLAARLLGAFRSWRRLEPVRRAAAESALRAIAATPGLSLDSTDIVTRALA